MVKLIGAVLVGGTSSRMGSDKALIDVGGRPLAQHGIDALVAAGIADVMLVGATAAHGEQLSGRVVDDLWPGDGPVGGLLSALHHGFLAGASHVVGLACDLPAVTGADVVALIGAWAEAAVTLVHVEGRPAPPNGVWPTRLLPRIESGFLDGADSFGAVLSGVDLVVHDGGAGFSDVDTPGDLARFL